MKREELLAQARKHLWAAWSLSSEEIGSQAAETLMGLGMLVPEGGAAELVRLRARVDEVERKYTFDTAELKRQLESARVDGSRLIRAEQRRAELEAVLGTHRKDDQAEIERLRAQVAELLAERHVTNEALDDAVQELGRRKDAELTPVTVFRASHDSIVMGHYTTRQAAQAHCEAKVQQEEPAGSIRHLSWSADDIGEDAEYELHITPAETGGLIRGTGYVVTPLEVASEYDPDGDE